MLISLKDLNPYKNGKNRLLGVDYGDQWIGLSLSDLSWTIATPLELSKNNPRIIDEFIKMKEAYDLAGIIIGFPLNMNGSEGPQAQKIRTFAEKLSQIIALPIAYWDERLSTMAVTRTLLEADVSRKKRKVLVDKMAASYILQGALDYLHFQK